MASNSLTGNLRPAYGRLMSALTSPWLLLLVAGLSVALYFSALAPLQTAFGFPLDDSWIHQTFARNLVQRHEFAYNPGVPSTGSTSPLWTLLLTPGYVLPWGYQFWTSLLGVASLAAVGLLTRQLSLRLFPGAVNLAGLAGLAAVLEWHLAWAGASGMETAVFTAAVLALIVSWDKPPLLVGAIAGIATLLRPEGAIVLPFILIARLARRRLASRGAAKNLSAPREGWVRLLIAGLAPLIAFSLVLLPYVAFNMSVAGRPLPTTFYAKNAAYGQVLSLGFVARYLWNVVSLLTLGPLLVLVPGLIFSIWRAPKQSLSFLDGLRKRIVPALEIDRWITGLLSVAWCIALVVLYLVRLPVLYHHGRYLFPLFPIAILFGLWGAAGLAAVIPYRLFVRVFVLCAALFWLALWVDGGVNKFAWDVKFINDEQVATAIWLRDNTPADALVATHDIGAIGFFSGRRILDTAGLITPSLDDRLKDQAAIQAYVRESGASYFALLPSWYPKIAASPSFETVFRVEQAYALAAGGDNMIVLQLR